MAHGFRAARTLVLPAIALCLSATATTQNRPLIAHRADECWSEDQFPQLAAGIQPGNDILTAKVYFRSDKYPDFYWVAMTLGPSAGDFRAVLPKPAPETEHVIYYLEAIDRTFSGARTEEYDPKIEDLCRRQAPAFFTGENPGIVVGATKAGAAALPPGFQAAGIVGVITAAGAGAGAGGGLGVGTAVAVAGAAAGAGAAVAVSGGGESSTTAPPSTTTSAPTAPATSTVSGTTSTISSAPSTTSIPPTTTTTTASTTSSSTSTAPATSTTTSPNTTTTASATPVNACFTETKRNSCVWRFDASCSSGPIAEYNWVIDPDGNMPPPRPPVNYSGKEITIDWNPPTYGGCSGSPKIRVLLTVVGSAGQTDSASKDVRIDLRALPEREQLPTSFISFLAPAAGELRGFLVLNGVRRYPTSSSVPASHAIRGLAGKNTIEAYLEGPSPPGGFWKFDFAGALHFEPGSLIVEQGAAASVDARSIVFRLAGSPGERIRFTFELSR